MSRTAKDAVATALFRQSEVATQRHAIAAERCAQLSCARCAVGADKAVLYGDKPLLCDRCVQYYMREREKGVVDWLVDLNTVSVAPEVLRLVSREIAVRYSLVPIKQQGDTLCIVLVNPSNQHAIADVKFVTGFNVLVVRTIDPINDEQMLDAITRLYGPAKVEERWLLQPGTGYHTSFGEDDPDSDEL